MNKMGKLFMTQNEIEANKKLEIIKDICLEYNKILYKYTLKPIGRLAVPVDINSIPKNFSNIQHYLTSQKNWVKISNLLEKNIDVKDTILILISHWKDIVHHLGLNKKFQTTPLANIILSENSQKLYKKYKELDKRNEEKNKKSGFTKNETAIVYDYSSDVYNLNKISKLNPSLSNEEIVTIFRGEFNKDFINFILKNTTEDFDKDFIIKNKLKGKM